MTNEEADDCLARASQGDNGALHDLYVALRIPVFHIAWSVTGSYDDAQDVLQDTFIRLKSCDYRQGNAKAFIFKIARNLSLTLLREKRRLCCTEPDGEKFQPGSEPEDTLDLHEALSRLPADDRQIVLLHVLGGMKHREAAAILQLPLGTELWKYQRAISRLQSYLKGRETFYAQRKIVPIYPEGSRNEHP